jgi:hypothetical protein
MSDHTGIVTARDNAWRMIVLGSRRTSFQPLDGVPIVAQVAKLAEDVPSADASKTPSHEAAA